MPRYAFECPRCGAAFEVARPVSQAAEGAVCPEDGQPATRVFTPPASLGSRGEAVPPSAAGDRGWRSPFFPDRPAARPAPPPRTFLPPGSSKPTSFRHFGHSHPAGTARHSHRRPR
jgi:putative FmdB family regulatory protein